ncbi:MAG: hypothetical protein SOV18_00995, partial [Eubacteriales bacterium]|nr:hypothetical protein [Eubacteriales bacterium]
SAVSEVMSDLTAETKVSIAKENRERLRRLIQHPVYSMSGVRRDCGAYGVRGDTAFQLYLGDSTAYGLSEIITEISKSKPSGRTTR